MKLDKFKEIKEKYSENISHITWTFEVIKFDKFNEIRDAQHKTFLSY